LSHASRVSRPPRWRYSAFTGRPVSDAFSRERRCGAISGAHMYAGQSPRRRHKREGKVSIWELKQFQQREREFWARPLLPDPHNG
jgi:hypothetical protein